MLDANSRKRGKHVRSWQHANLPIVWIVCGTLLLGCPQPKPPAPRDGFYPWEALAWVTVPGGVVNAAGGTLGITRPLLSIDTRLGPHAIAGVHHSAEGTLRWSFELELFDGVFVDGIGARHDVSALPDGAVVPGGPSDRFLRLLGNHAVEG